MREIRAPAFVPFTAGAIVGYYTGVHGWIHMLGMLALLALLVGFILLLASLPRWRYGPSIFGLTFGLLHLAGGALLMFDDRWFWGITLAAVAVVFIVLATRDLVRAIARRDRHGKDTHATPDNLS